jgi:hypothetical protein
MADDPASLDDIRSLLRGTNGLLMAIAALLGIVIARLVFG